MFIYLLFLLFCILCCISAGKNHLKHQQGALICLTVMMIMVGLRHEAVGSDTAVYLESFKKNIDLAKPSELLFNIVTGILPNPHLKLFFIAVLTYIPIFFILRREAHYAMVAVLVYMISPTKFFPESFNIIRQSLSASFVLALFVDWGNDKKKRALIWGLIAILFHNSSLIAIPFLLLRKFRFRFWFVYTSVGLTFFSGLFQVLNQYIILLTDSELNPTNEVALSYMAYLTNGTSFNTNYILASTLPLSAMCLLTYPSSERSRPIDVFFFNIMFVTTLIANIAIPATQFGFRLVFSLYIVQILVVANAFRYQRKLGRELLGIFLCLLVLLYVHYLAGLKNADIATIIPYQIFFL